MKFFLFAFILTHPFRWMMLSWGLELCATTFSVRPWCKSSAHGRRGSGSNGSSRDRGTGGQWSVGYWTNYIVSTCKMQINTDSYGKLKKWVLQLPTRVERYPLASS